MAAAAAGAGPGPGPGAGSSGGGGGSGSGFGSGSGSGSGSNPRKFSEKIALQKQRQAEETAAFEEVMMELGSTRLQAQKLRLAHSRGPYYSGSLPNVNQLGSGIPDFQGPLHSPLDSPRSTRHHGLVERVQRDPRRMMSPLRRYVRQIDSSPYGPTYLSPPPEPSWRRTVPWGNFPMEKGHLFRLPSALNRTNSDSALHTSVMNPAPQDAFLGPTQGPPAPGRRGAFLDGDADSKVPPIEETFDDHKHSLKPWDTKKLSSSSARPRSCEVPGIHVFPSPDPAASVPLIPPGLNTGGSLPDLTTLHFPSPLPTPLDPEESPFPSLSGGSSTGNLATTMTHLGISGSMALAPGYDSQGLAPPLPASLGPAAPPALGSPGLPPPLSAPPLPAPPPSSSSSSSSPSLAALAPPPPASSPRRRGPPGPGLGAESGRQPPGPERGHERGRSRSHERSHERSRLPPAAAPALPAMAQGVPLDSTRLPAEQRLPPCPFLVPHRAPPAPQVLPSAAPQLPPPYQPLGQALGDFALGTFDQFGMGEGSGPAFPEELGYPECEGGFEPHILPRPPHSNCSRHGGSVPNLLLTGDSQGISKEIAAALAGVPGFEVDAAALGLDEELRMEPLSLEGLSMLSDPGALLPDPAVEEAFRSDRLQ